MAPNARPTAAKRNREKALVERRQEKEARRRDAKERKQTTGPRLPGEDPDLAGIKLGPQPLADWQIEDVEPTETTRRSEQAPSQFAAKQYSSPAPPGGHQVPLAAAPRSVCGIPRRVAASGTVVVPHHHAAASIRVQRVVAAGRVHLRRRWRVRASRSRSGCRAGWGCRRRR